MSVLLWRSGWFGFPFGLIAPLAIAGILVFPAWDRKHVLLYLFLLIYFVSVVLFFVASRYRLPVVPILLLFAAHCLIQMMGAEARRGREIAACSVLLLVTFLAVNRGFEGFDDAFRGESSRYMGVYFVDRGRLKEAELAYRDAIAQRPDYPEAHAELAQVLQRSGRHQEALVHLLAAREGCPHSEKTHYLLGTGYEAVGDTASAEQCYRRALAMTPPFALAHRDLGILLLNAGRFDEASVALETAVRLDPNDVDSWYKLGQCYVQLHEYSQAERALRGALQLLPGDREIIEKIESLQIIQSTLDK